MAAAKGQRKNSPVTAGVLNGCCLGKDNFIEKGGQKSVITEAKKAASVLGWVVKEMESRYKLMTSEGVKNIDGYNLIFVII